MRYSYKAFKKEMRQRGYNRHHRKPKSRGGDNSPHNIAWVDKNKHRSYHQLFGTKDPHEVARQLTADWIDPDYVIIAIKKPTDN